MEEGQEGQNDAVCEREDDSVRDEKEAEDGEGEEEEEEGVRKGEEEKDGGIRNTQTSESSVYRSIPTEENEEDGGEGEIHEKQSRAIHSSN